MRRPLLALICCLSVAAVEAPALPATTTWLVTVDVRAVLSGPCGDLARQAIANARPAAKRWFSITGIDPLTDIDRVTASGTDFTPGASAIMLSGRFDSARLTTLAESAQGHQAISHGGGVIHRWIDPFAGNREVFAALVGGTLVFASNLETARDGIDALAGSGTVSDPAVNAARFSGPVVAVAAADELKRLPRLDQNAAVLRQISRLAACVQVEGDQVVSILVADAIDEATAGQLQQIGQGLLALALLNQDTPAQTKALLANTQLTRNGAELTLRCPVPIATIRAALANGGK